LDSADALKALKGVAAFCQNYVNFQAISDLFLRKEIPWSAQGNTVPMRSKNNQNKSIEVRGVGVKDQYPMRMWPQGLGKQATNNDIMGTRTRNDMEN